MVFHSQFKQDEILEKLFFRDSGPRFFIELGADNGLKHSNTKHFEEMGWCGLCIEARPSIYKVLCQNRTVPCINACISNVEETVEFKEIHGYGDGLSGIVKNYSVGHAINTDRVIKKESQGVNIIELKTRRLSDIFDEYAVKFVDYFSLDVEGSEMNCLRSIDWSKVYIGVFTIENNDGGKEIGRFMEQKGYEFIKKAGPDEIYVRKDYREMLNVKNVSYTSPWSLKVNEEMKEIHRDGIFRNVRIDASGDLIGVGGVSSKISEDVLDKIVSFPREPPELAGRIHTSLTYENMFHVATNFRFFNTVGVNEWSYQSKSCPVPWYEHFSGLGYLPNLKIYPLSCIISKKQHTAGGRQRVKWVQEYARRYPKSIHVYGRGWKNTDFPSGVYRGMINSKGEGLLHYRYSLCFENTRLDNYFTEKLTDCLLCWTVPIYWGAPNIENYFGKGLIKTVDIMKESYETVFCMLDDNVDVYSKLYLARWFILNEYTLQGVLSRGVKAVQSIYGLVDDAKNVEINDTSEKDNIIEDIEPVGQDNALTDDAKEIEKPKIYFGWFNQAQKDLYTEVTSDIDFFEQNDYCLEIGVLEGVSTVFLAQRLKSLNKNIKLIVIDPWNLELCSSNPSFKNRYTYNDELYDHFISNIKENKVDDIIIPIRSTSFEAYDQVKKLLNGRTLRFISIDGSHVYYDVLHDLQMYYPLLCLGGRMIGDDFLGAGGVKQAVIDYFSNHMMTSSHTYPNWVVNKPKENYVVTTMFFDIGREDWSTKYKRSREVYLKYIENLCSLNNDMIIYTEKTFIPYFEQYRKNSYNKTFIHKLSIEDLIMYKHLPEIKNIQDTSDLVKKHPNPDAPEVCCAMYNTVTVSKMDLLGRASKDHPEYTHFYWMDAGYTHGTIDLSKMVWHPGVDRLNDSKMQVVARCPLNRAHPNPKIFYLQYIDVLIGGFFGGHRDTIQKVSKLYYHKVFSLLKEGLIDDDQFYNTLVCKENLELFNINYGDWFSPIKW